MKEQSIPQSEIDATMNSIEKNLTVDQSSLRLGSTIESTMKRFELLHSETAQHCLRVGLLAARVADILQFNASNKVDVTLAGFFHDIGKAADVLLVENQLSENEIDYVKNQKHAQVGASLLSNMNYPEKIVTIVQRHHDENKWFENRLTTSTQIVMAADRFDAIQAARWYKPSTGHEQAWLKLKPSFGINFDPMLQKPFEKAIFNE